MQVIPEQVIPQLLFLIALIFEVLTLITLLKRLKSMDPSGSSATFLISANLLLIISTFLIALKGFEQNELTAVLSGFIMGFAILWWFGLRQIIRILESSSQVRQHLSQQLALDEVTQVMSKAEITRRAHIAIEQSMRTGTTLTFMLLDIDHFKAINDQFGHPRGDEVLLHIAQQSASVLREDDAFGRIGGDEFLAIFQNTDSTQAHQAAQRLSQRILKTPHPVLVGHAPTTLSIGLASFLPLLEVSVNRTSAELFEELYHQADQAMYTAKHQGKNQIVSHTNPRCDDAD